MNKRHKLLSNIAELAFILLVFLIPISCENNEVNGEGSLVLNITDAPVDDENITGVYITFIGIEYKIEDGEWNEVENFGDPVTINLLELQNGRTELLTEFSAGAGEYTGIRFILDAAQKEEGVKSNIGCYITFADSTQTPLFVPSGAQSGYKATGSFTVPVNGTVEITADFDLRKSVVKAGNSGKYILKPTIRVMADNEAGEISGTITPSTDGVNYVVYAYNAGSYTEAESETPEGEEVRFANAVSSTKADENGNYILSFLGRGSYDIVLVAVGDDDSVDVITVEENISVESNLTTELDFVL